MTVDRLDIEHVAHLARLDLTDGERATMGTQLLQILDYFELLRQFDTDEIEATFQVVPVFNRMRDDVEGLCLPHQEALANAPQSEEGCFRVPRIL